MAAMTSSMREALLMTPAAPAASASRTAAGDRRRCG
jgi:hypothetical protein